MLCKRGFFLKKKKEKKTSDLLHSFNELYPRKHCASVTFTTTTITIISPLLPTTTSATTTTTTTSDSHNRCAGNYAHSTTLQQPPSRHLWHDVPVVMAVLCPPGGRHIWPQPRIVHTHVARLPSLSPMATSPTDPTSPRRASTPTW